MLLSKTTIKYGNSLLKHSSGWKYYLVFAICGFSNALFFWVCYKLCLYASYVADLYPHAQAFLPETKGVPLEELDAYFESVPIFVPSSAVHVPDAETREEELHHGKVVASEGDGSVADEKDKSTTIEHV